MKKAVIILSLIFLFAPAAPADIIMFKDGKTLDCRVLRIVEDQACVQESGKEYYIPMSKIDEIIYVKKVKEDDTMKWVMGASAVGMCLLTFILAMWGRNL